MGSNHYKVTCLTIHSVERGQSKLRGLILATIIRRWFELERNKDRIQVEEVSRSNPGLPVSSIQLNLVSKPRRDSCKEPIAFKASDCGEMLPLRLRLKPASRQR